MSQNNQDDPQLFWQNLQQNNHSKYNIFYKNFIAHNKILNFKFRSHKPQSSFIKYQQSITKKDGKIDMNSQIKLWFLFNTNNQILAKIKQNIYDICYCRTGMQFDGSLYNFYGGIQHDNHLNHKIFKIGIFTKKPTIQTHFRLNYKYQQSNLIFQQKTQVRDNDWHYKTYFSYDIINRLLKNCQVQIGHNNIFGNSLYLRNKSKKQSSINLKNIFHKIILDYIIQSSPKNQFGISSVYKWDKKRLILGGIWQHKFNMQRGMIDCLKIKGDLDGNIDFSIKKNIQNYGDYIYGLKITDFGKTNKLNYGLSFNFNL